MKDAILKKSICIKLQQVKSVICIKLQQVKSVIKSMNHEIIKYGLPLGIEWSVLNLRTLFWQVYLAVLVLDSPGTQFGQTFCQTQ